MSCISHKPQRARKHTQLIDSTTQLLQGHLVIIEFNYNPAYPKFMGLVQAVFLTLNVPVHF